MIMGTTIWHKDKNGKDKATPYEEGVTQIPQLQKKWFSGQFRGSLSLSSE